MKALKFVPPTYEIPQNRKTLYTKAVGDGERLDIVAWPLNPHEGTTLQNDIDMAFKSVVWNEVDLDGESIADQVMRDWFQSLTFGDSEQLAMEAVRYDLLRNFSNYLGDPRTAYICPIISHGGVGYERGYVVAWEESDALDVAEYLAGGRVEILCGLIGTGEMHPLESAWLGELSYSDITGDTDNYRRVVEGEFLVTAVEDFTEWEAPEPQDPEFPGAELLETFTKLD